MAYEVERAIGLAVGHAEFEGWQPGEPIDLAALWYAGRVLTQRRSNALHPDRARSYTIEGVTIRLLRLVLAPPVEHTLGRRE
ncbi:MAG: hypothetical protein HY329_20175 [Chloroflexi bacterium]|nr:hypothetical protein [Chloroflexota bacterium]